MREPHHKEIFAATMWLLTTATLLLTIGKALGRFQIPAAALSFAAVCVYAIFRKIPSEIDSLTRIHLFPRWSRRLAWSLLILSIASAILSLTLYVPKPAIERIIPIDPIAGGKLQVFGHHFPNASDLSMRVGHDSVSEINFVSPEFLEVRVPNSATSGPIMISRKRTILPDQEIVFPVASVQNLEKDVVLITEDIRGNGAGLVMGFSVLNTTQRRQITINDVRLEKIVVEELSGPNFQEKRIDLGVHSALNEHEHGTSFDLRDVDQESVQLLDDAFTVKLAPMNSASFRFELHNPSSEHHARLVFLVMIEFFDHTGVNGRCFSNRLFTIELSDKSGISVLENQLLDQSAIDALERKFGTTFQHFGKN